MLASLLAFGGGVIVFYSAIEIENYGCDMYQTIINGPVPKKHHDPNFCHHFGEKIVGGVRKNGYCTHFESFINLLY